MCDLFALFVRKKNIVCGFWPWPMPNRVNNRILTNESIVTFSWNSSKTGNFDRCANLHLGELLTRVRFELNTFFLFYRNFCNAFFPICFFIALDEIVSSSFFFAVELQHFVYIIALWMRVFVSANAAWIFYAYRCILFASSIVLVRLNVFIISVSFQFYVSNDGKIRLHCLFPPFLIVRRVSTLALCCVLCVLLRNTWSE